MEEIKSKYNSLEYDIQEKFEEKLKGYNEDNPLMGEFSIGEGLASSLISGLYYDEDEEEVLMLWEGSDTWLNMRDELTIEERMEILEELD